MKRASLLLLAAASTAGALDFRPMLMDGIGEGGRYTYLEFRDEGKVVTYMPPRTWRFHGVASQLCLTVPETTGVEIDISLLAAGKPLPVEAENLSAFEDLARKSLPSEAVKVARGGVAFSPLIIDGHKTVEVTFDYIIFGGPIRVSFLYAAREKALVCFRVVSRPEDFERLHQAFLLSLHSFAGL
jgi:hypothetical protein